MSRSGAREAQAADEAAAWLQRFDCEPSVEAVQEAAAAFAGATPGRAVSWRSRVRKAPWLPELRVRVLRGLEEDVLTNASGQTHAQSDDLTLEVQARWRFDRLVFDRNELAVSREAVQLEELRRERVAEVTRLYFARRRLQVELVLDPPRSVRDRVGRTLTLDELTSELDGLTGGFFRRALRREHAPKP